jgi:hypothetical protein
MGHKAWVTRSLPKGWGKLSDVRSMQELFRRARNWSPRLGLFTIAIVLVLSSCSVSDDTAPVTQSPPTNSTKGPGVVVDEPGESPSTTAEDEWAEVLGEQLQNNYPAGKYVSPSGNNANGGTSPTDAWQSVAYGVSQLVAGDTLFLMDGTFNESARSDTAVPVTVQGRADAWIRITAYPGTHPIITSYNSSGMQFEGGAKYIEVSGIEFVGNPNPNSGGEWPGAGLVIFNDAHHIRVYNNQVHGYGAGGVVGYRGSHIDVRNNEIWENAKLERAQHSGISFYELRDLGLSDDSNGYSNYVMGNLVYRNENINRDPRGQITDGNCVIVDRFNVSGYSGRTLIANNVCIDNGGRSLNIFMSSNVDVFNNTAYHNLRTPEIANTGGEMMTLDARNIRFANNLIFTRPGLKPIVSWGSSNVSYTNNMFVGDTNPGYSDADIFVPAGTKVVANASTAATASNFDLVSGSPAANAGSSDIPGQVKTDYAGRNRHLGDAPDIGAFEFRESGSAPPPTTAPPTTAPPETAAPTTGPAVSPTTVPGEPAPTTSAQSTSPTTASVSPTLVGNAPTTAVRNAPSAAATGSSAGGIAANRSTVTTSPSLFAPAALAPTTIGPPPGAPIEDENGQSDSSPVVTTDSGEQAALEALPYVEATESNGSGLWIALSLVFLASGFGAMQMTNSVAQRRD